MQVRNFKKTTFFRKMRKSEQKLQAVPDFGMPAPQTAESMETRAFPAGSAVIRQRVRKTAVMPTGPTILILIFRAFACFLFDISAEPGYLMG